jgi:hypothetical protein
MPDSTVARGTQAGTGLAALVRRLSLPLADQFDRLQPDRHDAAQQACKADNGRPVRGLADHDRPSHRAGDRKSERLREKEGAAVAAAPFTFARPVRLCGPGVRFALSDLGGSSRSGRPPEGGFPETTWKRGPPPGPASFSRRRAAVKSLRPRRKGAPRCDYRGRPRRIGASLGCKPTIGQTASLDPSPFLG